MSDIVAASGVVILTWFAGPLVATPTPYSVTLVAQYWDLPSPSPNAS